MYDKQINHGFDGNMQSWSVQARTAQSVKFILPENPSQNHFNNICKRPMMSLRNKKLSNLSYDVWCNNLPV